MNIKTKLIIAATAVSLLSTPALAIRDMGDAGGDSAFAIPENHGFNGANSAYRHNAYSAYASGHVVQPRRAIHTQQQRQSHPFTGADAGHN
jgi:hypothetical protein